MTLVLPVIITTIQLTVQLVLECFGMFGPTLISNLATITAVVVKRFALRGMLQFGHKRRTTMVIEDI